MRLVRTIISILILQFIIINYISGAVTDRVAIVVNKYLKDEIDDNLNIYIDDLQNEGYRTELKVWDLENEPSPQALKEYLKNLYLEKAGLQGAVFIGDLPLPIMKANSILKNVKDDKQYIPISNGYIAEKYYMDLVGKEWTSSKGDYKLDDPHYESYWDILWNTKVKPETIMRMVKNGDLYPTPEIWTSRIMTSSLKSVLQKSEATLVNAYLQKNHAYRTGTVVFQKQNLLYSIPKVMETDETFNNETFSNTRRILSRNYRLDEPDPAPSKIYEFFEPLKNESYEMLYWGRHGNKTSIALGSENLPSTTLGSTNTYVSTAFVFPSSCLIGNYIEPKYFAGTYLFNNQFYALGMSTATLPTYGKVGTEIMDEFEQGNNLGQALKKAIEIPEVNTPSNLQLLASHIASLNSRYILGDGTLKLQSKQLVANKDNSPQQFIKNTLFGSKAKQEKKPERTFKKNTSKSKRDAKIAKLISDIEIQLEAAEIALKAAEIAKTSTAAKQLGVKARTAANLAEKIATQIPDNKKATKSVQKADKAAKMIEDIVRTLKTAEATKDKNDL